MKYEKLLTRVRRPSRYTGNELHVMRKDWDAVSVRLALVFPDLYEIGMSNQGLQILYQTVNRQPDMLAERVFAPDLDLEEELRRSGEPLFALESQRPLADFDVLGITLPYELCYTNILTVLDLAGIPFYAHQRSGRQPLIIGGGPCAFHPEPVADFFDAILLGDGEEAIVEMLQVIAGRQDRAATLAALARLQGVYVPALYKPEYAADGRLTALRSTAPGPATVRRRILPELPPPAVDEAPMVPLTRIVHDRLGLEVARGCTRGCRFCQAGIIYRPVRERSPAAVLQQAVTGLSRCGYEELALLSLSTGDYSCLNELLGPLMDLCSPQRVSVSMPSMRVGTLTPEIMEQIRRVRKTGFTLAPEAGSERLRRVINKGISEQDLLATCRAAAKLGWKLLKLYFMFGLPTETEADLEAIADLAHKAKQHGGNRCTITVSAATFVPKPHTPFQWEPQLTIDQGRERINRLRSRLRDRRFKMKWHDPAMSFLEGVMSRGDRRLAAVIVAAWRLGARLDAWSDHFDLERWQQAAADCGLDLAWYLRRREMDEILPWQHLDVGVDADFFARELARAYEEAYTPDCRVHACQKCGICDFNTVKPRVAARSGGNEALADWRPPSAGGPKGGDGRYLYRLSFTKTGRAVLLGHLEMIQVFYRALRRLGLPLRYSQGFHPTPRVTFSPALPVGIASLAEWLLVECATPVDLQGLVPLINEQLPEGLAVTAIGLAGPEKQTRQLVTYDLTLPRGVTRQELDEILRRESIIITRQRKGKTRRFDLRPLLVDLELSETGAVRLTVRVDLTRPGVKPTELAAGLFGLDPVAAAAVTIVKLGCRPWAEEEHLEP